MANNNMNEPPRALVQALQHLLRPLVRLLIHFQISYPYLTQLIKAMYVDVADKDFPVDGKRQTDSRVAMLTGVHRKDVRRLRSEGFQELPAPKAASLAAQVVAAWMSLPEYTSSNGEPKPLPRAANGAEPSFHALVETVSKQDLRARSVLDEWLRVGIVHVDDQDRLRLNVDAFVPRADVDEKAFFFGMNIHDHIAAACHNLTSDGPPRFDRNVYYNHLTAESVAKLETMVQENAMELLKTINRTARELQRRDSRQVGAIEKFNLGVFFYRDKDAERE